MRKPWTHIPSLIPLSVSLSHVYVRLTLSICWILRAWRESLSKRKPSYGNLCGVILHVCLVRLSWNQSCNHWTFTVESSLSQFISIQDIWCVAQSVQLCSRFSCHVSISMHKQHWIMVPFVWTWRIFTLLYCHVYQCKGSQYFHQGKMLYKRKGNDTP